MVKIRLPKNLKTKDDISLIIVLFTVIAIHSTQYLLWTLSAAMILVMITLSRGKFYSERIPGFWCIATLIFLGSFGGCWAFIHNKAGLWSILRDVIRATVFPLMWIAYSMLLRQNGSFTRSSFYKTLFCICGTSSVFDLIISLPARLQSLGGGFPAFVGAFSPDKYLIAIGLFLILLRPELIQKYFISMSIDRVYKAAIILNFALSFSRTAIVLVLIFAVPFLTKYTGKVLKLLAGILIVLILLSVFLPDVTSYFIYKILRSLQEIGYSDRWTSTAITSNWRGYEIYCEQQHFLRSSLLHQLFGDGYGATLNVGRYAALVTSEEALPFLHNGYYTALLKTGVFGVALNVFYYLSEGLSIHNRIISLYDRKFMFGILASMAFSAWAVGGILIGYMVPLYTLVLVWLPMCQEKDTALLV